MKIQNTFLKGTINKDIDERLVDSNELIDAENFLVSTTEGSNAGVGKNVPGTIKKTSYNILGGKTIGVGADENNNRIFNCIKGDDFDYIIEYNIETNTSETVLQSTTGGVLNFIEGERILNIDIISSGFPDEDLLAISGDSNPPRIFNILKAKTYGIDGFTEDEISVMKPSPIFAPTINLTTSVDGVENNFLEDKFICFSYRYKYKDGFYSAYSSWSRIAFEPRKFDLDYQAHENNGMINLSNAAEISFNTGPREVTNIELLFRESNSQTVYVIESFNKEKESWLDNTIQTFEFSKSKIFKVLPDDQFFRNFDNVPLSSVAQTVIGNRLAYANYIENYDIGVDIDFSVELVSTTPYLDETDGDLENLIDITDYSNIVDFEQGNEVGGSLAIDQMNFTTNEVEINLDAVAGAITAELIIEITPEASFSTTIYNIYVKEGITVLNSWIGVSGNQTKSYSRTSDANVYFVITSSVGLIYNAKLNYNIKQSIFYLSKWDYNAYHQLSFPKSTGYTSTLVGDTIINSVINFDMTDFMFNSGNQIRINFELKSTLVDNFLPSVTFFYNLTEDYLDLADFITNSNFKYILEGAFSDNFKSVEISNEGALVSFQGFLLTYLGDIMTIRTPKVVYNVNEPSGIIENKDEFYIATESNLQSVINGSFTSLHSNRDVEACIIYLDEKGRKTTALVSKNNTVHIPAENSILVNKLKIHLNNKPPTWAKYYKFGLKQIKKQYETIYGNQVYKDGIYRWIKLIGEDKNKVKEGDLLTIKSDYSGYLETSVKIKVLEVSSNTSNFIADNLLSSGDELIEESGTYFKIKQGNFDINIDQDTFRSFIGRGKRRYATRSFVSTTPLFGEFNDTNVFVPLAIKSGSQIRFFIDIKASGAIEFKHTFDVLTYAQDDYTSVKEWWESEIEILDTWNSFQNDYLRDYQWEIEDTFGSLFKIKPWRDGTASRDITTTVSFDINFSGGTLVFETEPFENLSTSFFETPETFTITDGEHEASSHVLNDAFDCFSFGNSVESFKIQDSYIGKSFSIDSNPTAVDEEGYKKLNRFADITYSGVLNSNTGLNKLNEFNLSLANYKEDVEKSYGPIMKIKGQNTDLDVFQEDKISKVFYGKDILFNADGTSNLSRIEDVLGQQVTSKGEYGISYHPDSFDEYGFNSFLTDTKRGVVLKNNHNNGLFEISFQGMRNYFKKLFRDNKINHINGQYDQFHDYYLLNIQYNDTEYVTWIYSDKDNGWLGRLKMNPEDMIRINSHLVAFKDGEVYLCNQQSNYNTFFGVESPSTFSFNFSQMPSDRKTFKNISIEGTVPTDIILKTEHDNGYINKEDFSKKEGVFYAYVRNSNDVIDTSKLSCQGIGVATINALILEFGLDLDPVISIGDKVVNVDLVLVGTIIGKTAQTLVMDTVNNITTGDFVLVAKPQSIEEQCLLGYYMQVDCEFSSNTSQEIFAINSEINKSFE